MGRKSLILWFVFLSLTGCPWLSELSQTKLQKFDVAKTTLASRKNVEEAKIVVDESSEAIFSNTKIIRSEMNMAEQESPDLAGVLVPRFDIIRESTVNLDNTADDLKVASQGLGRSLVELNEANKQAVKMEKEYTKAVSNAQEAEGERDKAIAEKNSLATKMLTYLIVIAVIGIGVSGALIFFGSLKMGIMGIVICSSVLVVAITVSKYFTYIAWGGLGILVIGAVFVVYQMFVHKKAIVETVETTELAKTKLYEADRKYVFGDGVDRGAAHGIQSSSTIDIISSARKKMKGRVEHTIKHEPKHDPVVSVDAPVSIV